MYMYSDSNLVRDAAIMASFDPVLPAVTHQFWISTTAVFPLAHSLLVLLPAAVHPAHVVPA